MIIFRACDKRCICVCASERENDWKAWLNENPFPHFFFFVYLTREIPQVYSVERVCLKEHVWFELLWQIINSFLSSTESQCNKQLDSGVFSLCIVLFFSMRVPAVQKLYSFCTHQTDVCFRLLQPVDFNTVFIFGNNCSDPCFNKKKESHIAWN